MKKLKPPFSDTGSSFIYHEIKVNRVILIRKINESLSAKSGEYKENPPFQFSISFPDPHQKRFIILLPQ